MSVTAPPETVRYPHRYESSSPPLAPMIFAVPPLDDAQNELEPVNDTVTVAPRGDAHAPVGVTSTVEYRVPLGPSALTRNVYRSARSGVKVGLRMKVDDRFATEPVGLRRSVHVQDVAVIGDVSSWTTVPTGLGGGVAVAVSPIAGRIVRTAASSRPATMKSPDGAIEMPSMPSTRASVV